MGLVEVLAVLPLIAAPGSAELPRACPIVAYQPSSVGTDYALLPTTTAYDAANKRVAIRYPFYGPDGSVQSVSKVYALEANHHRGTTNLRTRGPASGARDHLDVISLRSVQRNGEVSVRRCTPFLRPAVTPRAIAPLTGATTLPVSFVPIIPGFRVLDHLDQNPGADFTLVGKQPPPGSDVVVGGPALPKITPASVPRPVLPSPGATMPTRSEPLAPAPSTPIPDSDSGSSSPTSTAPTPPPVDVSPSAEEPTVTLPSGPDPVPVVPTVPDPTPPDPVGPPEITPPDPTDPLPPDVTVPRIGGEELAPADSG